MRKGLHFVQLHSPVAINSGTFLQTKKSSSKTTLRRGLQQDSIERKVKHSLRNNPKCGLSQSWGVMLPLRLFVEHMSLYMLYLESLSSYNVLSWSVTRTLGTVSDQFLQTSLPDILLSRQAHQSRDYARVAHSL